MKFWVFKFSAADQFQWQLPTQQALYKQILGTAADEMR